MHSCTLLCFFLRIPPPPEINHLIFLATVNVEKRQLKKNILQIKEQKERLSFTEKEEAWREMAKQVAHEVKNPLTPMKLTIQNFERKFDPNDPKILDKVRHLSKTMVDQIDLVATVANAFSQFAQLPEKNNEIFNLNKEIKNIINIFNPFYTIGYLC